MKVTLIIDDELLDRAHEYAGTVDVSVLVHDALQGMIEREAARRLALMGGTQPDLVAPPRRRFAPLRQSKPKRKRP